MRTLAILLLSVFPCAVAVAAPSSIPTPVFTIGRPVRVSLVNLSGKSRRVLLTTGTLDLPVGIPVDIDSRVGATMDIVSETDQSLDERILIMSDDGARLIAIH